MTMTIHTWKVLHNWASEASLYFNKWRSVHSYNGKPFSPALTSLEEGASSRIYTICRPSSLGGAQFLMESSEIIWWIVHQCRTEAELSLLVNQGPDLADTSTHTLTHRPKTHPDEPKRVEERGRAKFPIKDAQDQLWIWFDHLLQSRICQIQSICFRSDWFQSNRLRIHWFMILDLLHYSSIY